jgi:hypothetical protein
MICLAEILEMSRISPPFLALKDGPATNNPYCFDQPKLEE